jgi:hypothetical protein
LLADIEKNLTTQLLKAESLIGLGKRTEAERLLKEIDERFGGLAAPRTVDLQAAR